MTRPSTAFESRHIRGRLWAYETCNRCNYDRHDCPGCGEPLHHDGPAVCDSCAPPDKDGDGS